jgi:hypothetical protein
MSTLRADVARDWSWSDGYLPEIRRILALNAAYFFDLRIASYQQDVKQATDMLVSISRSKAVAIRLRRASYHQRDLTIRASRISGATTELAKIKAGHGDFYLYGWTQDFAIPEWMLIDLHKLRASRLLNEGWSIITNKDSATGFIAIPYTTLSLCGCVLNSRVYPH